MVDANPFGRDGFLDQCFASRHAGFPARRFAAGSRRSLEAEKLRASRNNNCQRNQPWASSLVFSRSCPGVPTTSKSSILDTTFFLSHTKSMPYTKEEHQQVAQEAARDQLGHFVKKPPEVKPEVVPPLQTVKVQIDTPKQKPNDSDNLVSLNIKNPLAVFTRSLMKAINKPMTIKIPPLYAFPILIGTLGIIPFSFFGLGKQVEKEKIAALPTPTPIVIIQPTATPAPVMVSRMGIIKATYQVTALLSPITSVIPSAVEGSPSATMEPSPTPTPVPNRFLLVNGSTITFLVVSSTVNLSSYLNRKVLITGLFDKTKNTLQISKSGDIEVLP